MSDTDARACWSCSRPAPSRGWPCRILWFRAVRLTEVLCPDCFARYGFPPKVSEPRTPQPPDAPRVYTCHLTEVADAG